MGSEQIYVDGKFIGEIIRLDETWTIKIEYGLCDEDFIHYFFTDLDGNPFFDRGTFMLRNTPEKLQNVLDSFGKYDRIESNIRRIALYENEEFISEIFQPYYP